MTFTLVFVRASERAPDNVASYSDSITAVFVMMKSTMLLRALFASAILLAGASSSSSSSVQDASAAVDGNNYDVDQIDQGLFSTLFEEWMTTHNKEYVSIEERSLRFMIWLENHGKLLL